MAGMGKRVSLTATFIKERLSLDRIPIPDAKGKVTKFEANPTGKRYVVFDAHQDSPVGFGIAVNKTNLSYILQRRVGKRVLKATLGDVRDMPLAQAREQAKVALAAMKGSGQSLNEAKRLADSDLVVANMTVAGCVAVYRHHLVTRTAKPAKEGSLKGLDLALNRLRRPGSNLADTRIGDLIYEDRILKAFDTLASSTRKLVDGTKRTAANSEAYEKPIRTATEQTFRWISRAVDYCMEKEMRLASNAKRPPSLVTNPFHVLRHEGRYRTREVLEKAYEDAAVRNPMQLDDGTLGRFLDALWVRRRIANYRTACDYLLLTLLWGTRRGEAAPLAWRDRITKKDALVASYVDLDAGFVRFHDTKNGFDHTLPLAPGARRLLAMRHEDSDGDAWVFPARSSKAKQGHYLDSKAILDGLRKAGGIEVLRTHDLRRTFATVAEEMTSYVVLKRLLNHRNLRDVTLRYPQASPERLLKEMARVERAILSSSRVVALALLPVDTAKTTLERMLA